MKRGATGRVVYRPKVIGHIEVWRAQLTTLSRVDNTYSDCTCEQTDRNHSGFHVPALFRGCSKLNWFEPCFAMLVMGLVAEVDEETSSGEGEGVGVDECRERRAMRD